ncbi:ROK family protein [Marinomonas sp. C2222]|uniref:ROK family protein n=1 Tax=Marinomonas sargassi TaxID=2984494 RepID=A0ABT2YQI6_9GAMM|nr:ROK family protein [Marinomonas sargassi]MCV2402158.1 ROK family protein [Marinomonas sargassi]
MKSFGSTAEQSRIYNERVILHLVRQFPDISRANLAKQTGLSAQTISVITSSLLERQLLSLAGKVSGRRGQPSIKLKINEQGAYGLGINLDRDHISAALIDFSGACVLQLEREVSFPTEIVAKQVAQDLIAEVQQTLGSDWCKVEGIGLARPDYMHGWLESLVTDINQRSDLSSLQLALEYWTSNAFEEWLAEFTGLRCYSELDSVAAVNYELLLAGTAAPKHFFYLFVSTACGGSFVANGECYFGATGKAGSFGLIPSATGKHGKWVLEALSLSSLRRYFIVNQQAFPINEQAWQEEKNQQLIDQWAGEVAQEVQPALASVIALYDAEAILIGGRLPSVVMTSLIHHIEVTQKSHSLLPVPPIHIAQTAHAASVLGAAVLPLYETFAPHKDVLLLNGAK